MITVSLYANCNWASYIMVAAGALPWWSISLETSWDDAALHSRVSCCWDSSPHDAVGHLISVISFSFFVFLSYITWATSPSSYRRGWYSFSECVHLTRRPSRCCGALGMCSLLHTRIIWQTRICLICINSNLAGSACAGNNWDYKT